jgi:thioesterase domain-containing protein
VLVDSEPPNITPPRENPASRLLRRALFYWRDGRLWNAIAWKLGLLLQQLAVVFGGTGQFRRVAQIRRAHARAHSRYRSGKFAGVILFIRSQESQDLRDKDWHLRWSELIDGETKTYIAPVTHANLVREPGVREIAHVIKNWYTADRS